jgi:recombination protein RecT
MGSIMTAAQLNLEVDPAMGECALVPYWDSKKNKWIVQFQPMYRGLLTLVRRSGLVKKVITHCFYENEVKNGNFQVVYGIEERIDHIPMILGDRGALAGAYAIAIMNDGDPVIEFMTRDEIIAIRDRKKDKDGKPQIGAPWRTDESEMFRKTVLKRVCKYLPKSYIDDDKFEKAIQIDNAVGDGKIANIENGEVTIDGETGEVTEAPGAESLKTVSEKPKAATPAPAQAAPQQEILPPHEDMDSMFPVG